MLCEFLKTIYVFCIYLEYIETFRSQFSSSILCGPGVQLKLSASYLAQVTWILERGLFTEAGECSLFTHSTKLYPAKDTHVPRHCDSQHREIQANKTDVNHNDFKRSYKIIYASLFYFFLEIRDLLILPTTEKAVTFRRGLESWSRCLLNRLASNNWQSPCLNTPSVAITGMSHHTQLQKAFHLPTLMVLVENMPEIQKKTCLQVACTLPPAVNENGWFYWIICA